MKFSLKEIKTTAMLAIPIAIGQLGHVITGIADYTMLGHYSSNQMASATFATSVFFPIMILGIGLSIGLTPVTAKANGAKEFPRIKGLFSNGLRLNLIIGVLLFLGLKVIQTQLYNFNQPPEVVDECLTYFWIISFSIIPLMLFQGFKQFVEALQDTKTPMYITLICNGVNIILNYFLIFGKAGFPALGIVGAGVSTLISRILMLVLFVLLFLYKTKWKGYLKSVFREAIDFKEVKNILSIGLPVAIYMFFEVTAFSAATFMVGWIDAPHLSAHQIALSLASMSFVTTMGVGNAGSIRSATYLGEGRIAEIKKVAVSVVVITLVLNLLAAAVFLLFNDALPLIFVPEKEVLIVSYASSMLILASLFQFSDGLQVAFQGLLQGIGDVKIPSFIAVFSYWAIGLPFGYYLAFHKGFSAEGIWIGLAVGLTFSAVLQTLRYRYSYRKLLK